MNINFVRGLDPKESLGIGLESHCGELKKLLINLFSKNNLRLVKPNRFGEMEFFHYFKIAGPDEHPFIEFNVVKGQGEIEGIAILKDYLDLMPISNEGRESWFFAFGIKEKAIKNWKSLFELYADDELIKPEYLRR